MAHERTDLAAMVRAVHEVDGGGDVPGAGAVFPAIRAFNEAKTPPSPGRRSWGSRPTRWTTRPTWIFLRHPGLSSDVRRMLQAVEKAMRGILAEASNPLMIVSDRIAQSGASEEAVRVAELLGCPVHTTIMHSEFNFPESHPQFRGPIRLAYPERGRDGATRPTRCCSSARWRRVTTCSLSRALDYFGPNTKLIHVDTDPTQVGDDAADRGRHGRRPEGHARRSCRGAGRGNVRHRARNTRRAGRRRLTRRRVRSVRRGSSSSAPNGTTHQ